MTPALHTMLASSFDWSGVSSFIYLGGDVSPGETALSVLSQFDNINNAAVLEPPSSLKNAVQFAPQLRRQFGEKNFNKLVYVPGDVHSGKLPAGYDVYIIKNLKSWNESHWMRLLRNVHAVMANEKNSLLIATTSNKEELKEALDRCGLHIWKVKETPEVLIVEARVGKKDE
jgi:hypothetical protein